MGMAFHSGIDLSRLRLNTSMSLPSNGMVMHLLWLSFKPEIRWKSLKSNCNLGASSQKLYKTRAVSSAYALQKVGGVTCDVLHVFLQL